MTNMSRIANLLASVCFLVVAGRGPLGLEATPEPALFGTRTDAPDPGKESASERHYAMTARVRPLLFWISFNAVGGATISWLQSANGDAGLELLVGSDPARAPMKINRWGYVAERVSGSSAELIGVMTESDEQTIEQATTRQTETGGTHAFKAIRGKLDRGLAQSTVIRMLLTDDFTYREAETLLRRLPQSGPPTRRISVPGSAQPGFLFAVKGMVRESVEACRLSGASKLPAPVMQTYVYDATLYELVMKSSRFQNKVKVNGREYRNVIESQFETRNTRTGTVSEFNLTYGTEGPCKEIPICIVYRPRWWFEAELDLENVADAAAADKKDSPWAL